MLRRAVQRIRNYNEDGYLKAKVWDKWRAYLHMRKLFKYWLGFAEKRGEFLKADLHIAFDKWKRCYPEKRKRLEQMKKEELQKKMLTNQK